MGVTMKWLAITVAASAGFIGALFVPSIHLLPESPHTLPAANSPQPSAATGTAAPSQTTAEKRTAFDARQTEATRTILEAQNKFLTGDPHGRAEWIAADDEAIRCGVSPEGRYLIVQNAIGQTRYDENLGQKSVGGINFGVHWYQAKCDATAPVRQNALLAKAAEERLYDATHPIDPDCLIREMKRFGKLGNVEAKRQLAHPHLCQQPRAVWEAALPELDDDVTENGGVRASEGQD